MSQATQLHVQAMIRTGSEWRFAALLMEGEARDQARADTLHTAVRSRSLPMITDPDLLPLRPCPGWRLRVDRSDAVTVEWPHYTPLLSAAPIDLPERWLDTARGLGVVLLFAGQDLGLTRRARDDDASAAERLREAATRGMLAAGAIVVAGFEAAAANLDGTVGWPRRRGLHRPRRYRRVRGQPFWASRLHDRPV